jgi:hypothetical protein
VLHLVSMAADNPCDPGSTKSVTALRCLHVRVRCRRV